MATRPQDRSQLPFPDAWLTSRPACRAAMHRNIGRGGPIFFGVLSVADRIRANRQATRRILLPCLTPCHRHCERPRAARQYRMPTVGACCGMDCFLTHVSRKDDDRFHAKMKRPRAARVQAESLRRSMFLLSHRFLHKTGTHFCARCSRERRPARHVRFRRKSGATPRSPDTRAPAEGFRLRQGAGQARHSIKASFPFRHARAIAAPASAPP